MYTAKKWKVCNTYAVNSVMRVIPTLWKVGNSYRCAQNLFECELPEAYFGDKLADDSTFPDKRFPKISILLLRFNCQVWN